MTAQSWPDGGTPKLPPAGLKYLNARGISADGAKDAGVLYLDADESTDAVGKLDDKSTSDGLAFPFPGTDTGSVRFLANDPKPKFKSPRGSAPRFYLGTFGKKDALNWKRIKKNATVKIYITEGPVKGLCGTLHGIATIGLNGVYGWSCNRKPLTDFDLFQWKGRIVVLCFDSDVTNKYQVQQALKDLADVLTQLGASVLIKVFDDTPNGGNVGMDDFIAQHGAKAFSALPEIAISDPRFADWGVHPVVKELNAKHALVMLSGKAAVISEVSDQEHPGTVKVEYSKTPDLHIWYANRLVEAGVDAKGNTKFRPASEVWLRSEHRREFDGVVLAPNEAVPGQYNLWRGWAINPVKPDAKHSWSLLRDHVLQIVAGGDQAAGQWLLAFMADAVKNPGRPAGVSAVLQGVQGSGKGLVWNSLGHLYGRHYSQVTDPRHIVGNFNSHLADKLLIFVDEGFYAGDRRHASVLKGMITEPTVMIEPKGLNAFAIKNLRRVVFASNNDWVVPAGIEERRFAVFAVKPDKAQNREYFGKIVKQLEGGGYEAMLWDLLHHDLSAVDLFTLPTTNALWQQKQLSWDDVTAFWFSCLRSGQAPPTSGSWGHEGTGEIAREVLVMAFASTLPDSRGSDRALETKLGMGMKKLCPELKPGRVSLKINKDRPWGYRLPPLLRCRELFELQVKARIDWASGEARGAL
jgi:hypothetical protein